MGKAFVNYRIEERSFVSYIKREIHMEVTRAGFSEKQIAEIDIIVSEATSNLIKHAGSGEVLYRTTMEDDQPVFEFLCIDKGPGMSDVDRMIMDGVSTTGTLGHGLGAIHRLSTQTHIYSQPGIGTILYCNVSKSPPKKYSRKTTLQVDVRAVCVSKPRETVCGDGYELIDSESTLRIFFGDGLGHGEHAKAAIDVAREYFRTTREQHPVEIIRGMHGAVRRTRGLVAAIAIFDKQREVWTICGVGNIAARLYNGLQAKNYMSYNGTVGLNIPNSMNESVFPAERNQHLIMCTDGIRSRWNVVHYPTIFKYDNSVLAAALYRDCSRGNDDASVLIAKVS